MISIDEYNKIALLTTKGQLITMDFLIVFFICEETYFDEPREVLGISS